MIGEQAFKDILCQFATGVTIVTFYTPQGQAEGLTVNAFCSLSLHPASVLVCISKRAECYRELVQASYFGVNLLHSGQQDYVYAFAATGAAKQAAVRELAIHWQTDEHHAPLFPCLAQLECRQRDQHGFGDHTILIGEVHAGQVVAANAEPLVYLRRGFFDKSAPKKSRK